jgi:hypothetical protein
MGREEVIARLVAAMRAAIEEVREDPEFAGKVVNAVCKELGLDMMASMYLTSKFKSFVKKKDAA